MQDFIGIPRRVILTEKNPLVPIQNLKMIGVRKDDTGMTLKQEGEGPFNPYNVNRLPKAIKDKNTEVWQVAHFRCCLAHVGIYDSRKP